MAGEAKEKNLFALLRSISSEKSQGERRVINLKKRIDELRSEVEVAHDDLEKAKLQRGTAEQELKGYKVELAIHETSIQAFEARVNSFQNEIATVRSEILALKNEERTLRDDFVEKMIEFNGKIRKFQDLAASYMPREDQLEKGCKHVSDRDSESAALQKEKSNIMSQTKVEEKESEAEKNHNILLKQELRDAKRKLNMMETIMKNMEDLKGLTRYPS